MADINFDINPEVLEQFVKQGRNAIAFAIRLTATEVWGNLRKETPVDQGRLAGSFQLEQAGEVEWKIPSGVHYALDVHEGREPNNDVPFAPIAAWAERKGLPPGPIWTNIKKHGTKPNKFADRSIENTEKRLEEFIQMAINNTMKEV